MNPIQYQVSALQQTLFSEETGSIYLQALVKTWKLLRQIVVLALLLGLLAIAFVVWVWTKGFVSGQSFRDWLETQQPTPQQIGAEILKLLQWPFQQLVSWSNQTMTALTSGSSITLLPPAEVSLPCIEASQVEVKVEVTESTAAPTQTASPGKS